MCAHSAVTTLSFWLTDQPVDESIYPSAPQLLVNIYDIFKDVYIGQRRNYITFLSEALTRTTNFPLNENKIEAVTNRLTPIFRRIYVILTRHRKTVIETFTHMSSFDTGAAQFFIDKIEIRRKTQSHSRIYPDITVYERLAECANRFGLFTSSITGQDIINIRDGVAAAPLATTNVSQAVFFLGALAHRQLLPKQWKSNIVSQRLMVNELTGEVPTAKYLRNISSLLDIPTTMETMAYIPMRRFYALNRYETIAKNIVETLNDVNDS